ncbi:MAG TPA: DUF5996 family protein [Nitrospira sp.]|nr:DUF5996 family protein [Nitrospira sp.]
MPETNRARDLPSDVDAWPPLPLEGWEETYLTLHRWTQIVGKIRLAVCPHVNHWWHTTLYLTARGLTTGPMPYGERTFQIDFDFVTHHLDVVTDDHDPISIPLMPRSVADFYREMMATLARLRLPVSIWTTPVEVADRTPFEEDHRHASYDPEYAHRCWRILSQAHRVLTEFRGRFLGKASPVHFFWGSFDLAATRFSGRPAPQHPGAPDLARYVAVEAYSHEVSSCGFWPGLGLGVPAFYSYAYSEPHEFRQHVVYPAQAYYHETLREFILPYDAVRTATLPDDALLAFAQTAYEAAATTANWDREALERTQRPSWRAKENWYR